MSTEHSMIQLSRMFVNYERKQVCNTRVVDTMGVAIHTGYYVDVIFECGDSTPSFLHYCTGDFHHAILILCT